MLKQIVLVSLVLSLLAIQVKQINRRKVVSGKPSINYPIRVGYVDHSHSWYGDAIASGIGVPGYSDPHDYNYIFFAFWMCNSAPKDVALIWTEAAARFGPSNSFGNTTDQIQKAIKKLYNDNGIKVFVSAFGDSEMPTTLGEDPIACGYSLGQYVKNNNLDGVDIDWQDNAAMNSGIGEEWIIKFTLALHEVIPNHTLTHAPQAPYFKNQYYKNGGYITVDREVGHLIDFYMIQFYNQVNSRYDSYEQLFVKATGDVFNGTAVAEIAARGVPLQKLVVGKPITKKDVSNTGLVSMTDLGSWSAQAYVQLGWFAGLGHWQYPSDLTGKAIADAARPLIEKCNEGQDCSWSQ